MWVLGVRLFSRILLNKKIDVNSIYKAIDVRRNIDVHALWLVNQLGYPIRSKFFGRK